MYLLQRWYITVWIYATIFIGNYWSTFYTTARIILSECKSTYVSTLLPITLRIKTTSLPWSLQGLAPFCSCHPDLLSIPLTCHVPHSPTNGLCTCYSLYLKYPLHPSLSFFTLLTPIYPSDLNSPFLQGKLPWSPDFLGQVFCLFVSVFLKCLHSIKPLFLVCYHLS